MVRRQSKIPADAGLEHFQAVWIRFTSCRDQTSRSGETSMSYRAPVSEIAFMMRHVAGLDEAIADNLYGDLTPDLAVTILEEAGRFAGDVIAPLNQPGDR